MTDKSEKVFKGGACYINDAIDSRVQKFCRGSLPNMYMQKESERKCFRCGEKNDSDLMYKKTWNSNDKLIYLCKKCFLK